MKNKQLLLILITALPLAGFSQKIMTTYYDYKHTIKHESYTTDNNGLKNGTYTEYAQNGKIINQGQYKNDKQVGKWILKSDKGELLCESNFDNDGLLNGLYIKYQGGHKSFESNDVHGTKIYEKEWYENGEEYGENAYKQLHTILYYNKNGSYDSTVEYSTEGKILNLAKYKDGVKTIALSYKYKYYTDQGEPTDFIANARYYRVMIYSTGDSRPRIIDYYMTGEKKSEASLSYDNMNGPKVGSYIEFYKNGSTYIKGKYDEQGNKDSIWNSYKVNGQDSLKERYNHGKLIIQ